MPSAICAPKFAICIFSMCAPLARGLSQGRVSAPQWLGSIGSGAVRYFARLAFQTSVPCACGAELTQHRAQPFVPCLSRVPLAVLLRVHDMLGFCLLFLPWKIERLLPYRKEKFNKEINSDFLWLILSLPTCGDLCRELIWRSVAPRSSCCNVSALGVQQLSYQSLTQSWWPMVPRDVLDHKNTSVSFLSSSHGGRLAVSLVSCSLLKT